MPTLNIDVNARVEKAKKDLRDLDKEVLKISKSEDILETALKKGGDVGSKAFRKIQSAAVRQAKAVNTSALQFKQLRAQMIKLDASPATIGRVTSEFVRFRKEMERGVVGTTKFQKAQDRLKATLGAARRQVTAAAAATAKANKAAAKANKAAAVSAAKTGRAAMKGGKSVTGLGKSLENLGSTAVLVAGPLSGIGSRLIAFGAIAKRGSLITAGLFSALAAGTVIMSKAINAFDKLNLSLAKTKAILKATGKEAQITAKFVNEVAANVARKTLANLEDTRPGAAALISFKGIDIDNLERVLILSQDVSSLGLTDLNNALKMLGRTSEDPIKNLDSLRRAGIQFTLAQKDQITTLQNMGRGMEAFGLILDIIEKKVGGLGESENIGLAGALDRLGQSWTELLETLGEGSLHVAATKSIEFFAETLEWFENKLKNVQRTITTFRSKVRHLMDLESRIYRPPKEGRSKPLELTVRPKFEPPSHFEKALIDVNIGVKRSLMDLNTEMEKLQSGSIRLSPRILKLAERFGLLPQIIKALGGDFNDLRDKWKKIVALALKTSDALLDLQRKQEGTAIFKSTRTDLEKYNIELKKLIFLYDNAFISADTLVRKQKDLREAIIGNADTALKKYNKELQKLKFFYDAGGTSANDFAIQQGKLRAALEAATPELNILTSMSEKFGDSLADLVVKGENFAEGLKSIFKSMVDDIVKQFFKLSVINPIMNGIFGASSSRPEFGSQGGGNYGLGGAGGLLGKIMGNTSNDNKSQKALDKVAEKTEEVGYKGADQYAEALEKTNVKMEKVGAEGSFNFGTALSGMAKGLASAAGGAVGSFLGNKVADLLGFQHGGSFKVGGSGGRDSQLVAFKASPREKVTVETPGQQKKQGNGNVTYIDARGVDPGQMDRLIQVVKDLDESVEIRAVNSVSDARTRNPSLFGNA